MKKFVIALGIFLLSFIGNSYAQNSWDREKAEDGLIVGDCDCIFVKVSSQMTRNWVQACRSAKHVPCLGIVECFRDSKQMTAIADFISLWYGPQRSEQWSQYEFILWRLTSYMPPVQNLVTIKDKFEFLETQIDSLVNYDMCTQWDYNLGEHLYADMVAFKVMVLEKELLRISDVHKSEIDAYRSYFEACHDVLEYLLAGKETSWRGTSFPMLTAQFYNDRYTLRNETLKPFIFFISDGVSPIVNDWSEFTPNLVDQEYVKYRDSLKGEEDEYTYSLSLRKGAIEKERAFFANWMNEREAVCEKLPEDQREAYRHQTNHICRMNYIILKNRNLGYGSYSSSLDEYLLQPDWSDERIISAPDAESAYFNL